MKHWLLLTTLMIAVACANTGCSGGSARYPRYPRSAQGVVVDIGFFYDELAPYGRWFSLEGYGWVWTPYDVQVNWRPYTYGYWVYTDYGWTWVSHFRWGWAPFHYGRWAFHHNHGWVWQPGNVWGPAWVVWRHRPGWIGWAPMPPAVEWRRGSGLHAEWRHVDTIVEPFWYSFVEERNFTDRNLNNRLEHSVRNATLLPGTENVTSYAAAENRVINRSISVERIEQSAGRPVARQRVIDAGTPGRGGEIRGNDVILYRPSIERETTDRTPRQAPARKTDSTLEQMRRREETEQRQLEIQQAREREALEKRQQIERAQPPARVPADEIRRQQENERRVLEAQKQREQQILKSRQEQQRREQTIPQAPTRKEQERKPAPERKPPPQRKP